MTAIPNYNPSNIPQMHQAQHDIQGKGTMSKIDFYGLGAYIKALRENKGKDKRMSYDKIAKELNEKYCKGDIPRISKTAVVNWCRKNIDEDDAPYETDNMVINVYHQECEMLKTLDRTLETIEVMVDIMNTNMDSGETPSVKDLRDIASSLSQLIAQKKSLINSIEVTQEKIYNYMAVTEIINTVMRLVQEKDEFLYAQIKEQMSKNPMLLEAFRRIKQ